MWSLLEIVVSVGVFTTLVSVLSACVCGCKNSNQKSELVGTAGVVKIRFDEEAPSPTPTTPASVKRASTQNSQRSLPEIPQLVGRHDSGDTASEIYATVNLDQGTKAVPSTSNARDRPYEHAYAKLQSQLQNEANVTVEMPAEDSSVGDMAIDERNAAQNGPDSVVISASVAISGQLPSSRELPYITPPPQPQAQHFSGDSTDSAKGYTSISVREPLSNIRASAPPPPSGAAHPAGAGAGAGGARDPQHYACVSDDSDEMYAAIEEREALEAGSGSDTYAQIAPDTRRHHARRSAPPEVGVSQANATHSRQASSSSCTNSTGALGSPKPEKRSANSPLPPTPHGNTAHTAHTAHGSHGSHATHNPTQRVSAIDQRHQRISSTGDLINHDKLRRSLNEKHQRNNSCVSSSDFYGCNYPVDKHRYSSGDRLGTREIATEEPSDNLYNSIPGPVETREDRVTESPSRNVEEMYAKVLKRAKKAEEARKSKEFSEAEAKKYRDDPGYETIDRKKSVNHGYETIVHKERKISHQDPGYETVKDQPNNLNNNLKADEPLYSTDNNASDSDPNYEVLRSTPQYAAVSKRPRWTNNNEVDPNYESMSEPEPLYARAGSESDPNYESVRPKDPNYDSIRHSDPNYDSIRHRDDDRRLRTADYESVSQDPNYESLRCKDPKYESVRSKDSSRSKKDPNYESVKYFDLKDPPYEKVNNEGTSVERSDSAAGYEKINIQNNRDPKGNHDPTVSDYFQV